jgi:HEAT repeat protein
VDEAERQSAALALGRLTATGATLEALSRARTDASAAVALAAAAALAAP